MGFELIGPPPAVHARDGIPLIPLRRRRWPVLAGRTKWALDYGVSLVAIVSLAPLFVAVAIAIVVDSPGPVFFRQVRVGRRGERFGIWKFRTMIVDADVKKAEVAHLNKHLAAGHDARMFKIEQDPRTTAVGRFLRRYSLDELPQLVNVLRGQMSLVGPRPLIPEEDGHVDAWGRCRLDVKPGMTGVWQVRGRDRIPFEEMVRLDYLYVTSRSLLGDLKLIAETLPVVLRGRGT